MPPIKGHNKPTIITTTKEAFGRLPKSPIVSADLVPGTKDPFSPGP